MRLFIVSWAFPPMPQPRAVQVGRYVANSRLPAPIVLCGEPRSGGSGPPPPERAGLTVERIADRLPALSLRIANRIAPGLGQRPDAQRGWAWLATRRLIRRHRPWRDDILVTFGQPMSCHLVGLAAKRAGVGRWVAHFSDPWADNSFLSYGPATFAANARLEAAVWATADALVYTTSETVDLVSRRAGPELPGKSHVVPHAFAAEPSDTDTDWRGPLVVRHVGNLYGQRGPKPVLAAIATLAEQDRTLHDRVRFEFVGGLDNTLRAELDTMAQPAAVAFVDSVAYTRSLSLMAQADLLLLVEAPIDSSVFLPSKLVDYIGAGRPVFAISPEGAAARIVRSLGGIVAPPDNPGAIVAGLRQALDMAEAYRGRVWGDPVERARYHPPVVAAALDAIVRGD